MARTPAPDCKCYFCITERAHPASHQNSYSISHRLLVAESLDPKHSVKRWACETCGHVTEEVPQS